MGFRWRDRFGDYHKPAKMDTHHIFFTWLMIWNHSAPEGLRVKMGNRYGGFPPFYTPKYMLSAFANLYWEMKRRQDTTMEQRLVIARIEANFAPVLKRLSKEAADEAMQRALEESL